MSVLEETQSIANLARLKDHLFLSHVAWEAYNALLDECEDRRLRHTFDRGRLEFMTRSSEHEVNKSLLGLFVVTLADELDMPLFMGGELTLRSEELDRGLESDQCFWITNESKVRGKKQIDLAVDPAPDLFIEIEVSRAVLDRLAVAAALGIREIWRYDGVQIHVGLLQADGQYHWQTRSPLFPNIALEEIARFLQMAGSSDHIAILRAFRQWVRDQKQQ
jgi:Uma2 family endonuclease